MSDATIAWAMAYVARGWKVFPLAVDGRGGKIPPRNCPKCAPTSHVYVPHDKTSCECLTCHGFHAASDDASRVLMMLDPAVGGVNERHLAVRTGRKINHGGSGLIVLDAEADDPDNVGKTGLDILDDIESWLRDPNDERDEASSSWTLPRETLTARSVSGGVHIFMSLPDWAPPIKSGRILPGVDVKCDNAYVGVPTGHEDRAWIGEHGWQTSVIEAPRELIQLVARAQRRRPRGGRVVQWRDDRTDNIVGTSRDAHLSGYNKPIGYDFNEFFANGCPDGYRDIFTNDLLFRLRKRNVSRDEAEAAARGAFRKYAQPWGGAGGHARYEMPWWHVTAKLDRIWKEVEPEAPLPDEFVTCMRNVDPSDHHRDETMSTNVNASVSTDVNVSPRMPVNAQVPRRVGRAMIVSRRGGQTIAQEVPK